MESLPLALDYKFSLIKNEHNYSLVLQSTKTNKLKNFRLARVNENFESNFVKSLTSSQLDQIFKS